MKIDLPDSRLYRSTFATVDPGLRHTGISIWRKGELQSVRLILGSKKMHWLEAATNQTLHLRAILEEECDIDIVWCEFPEHMGSSAIGSAAAIRGDTLKLAYLVGMIAQTWIDACANRGSAVTFIPLPPTTWKGQMPKSVMVAQVIHILGKDTCTEFKADVWDAVAIGLWVRELFPICKDKKGVSHDLIL